MIYLDVLGRCGNQMFQYAFAKRITLIQNDSLSVNFDLLDEYAAYWNNDSSFRDELQQFHASHQYEVFHGMPLQIYKHGSKQQKRIYKCYRVVRKLLGKLGLNDHIAERKFRFILAKYGIYLDCVISAPPFSIQQVGQANIFIKGYFENPVYFEEIENALRADFVPLQAEIADNHALYQEIRQRNSVCVSFRKWEVSGREICDAEYYQRAIQYMQKSLAQPLFVIFSNDISWVKAHFSLPENCLFETENNPIWEKVRLMSSCKHFIISNSTFSWWTQFLGTFPEKMVVSPNKWMENEPCKHALIGKDMITL